MNELFICEAGMFWRRVLRRLDCRINAALKLGYAVTDMKVIQGRLRIAFVVSMAKKEEAIS